LATDFNNTLYSLKKWWMRREIVLALTSDISVTNKAGLNLKTVSDRVSWSESNGRKLNTPYQLLVEKTKKVVAKMVDAPGYF
jgi:1,2-phenylacetyl-CoA epoxidase PaaB subunit